MYQDQTKSISMKASYVAVILHKPSQEVAFVYAQKMFFSWVFFFIDIHIQCKEDWFKKMALEQKDYANRISWMVIITHVLLKRTMCFLTTWSLNHYAPLWIQYYYGIEYSNRCENQVFIVSLNLYSYLWLFMNIMSRS